MAYTDPVLGTLITIFNAEGPTQLKNRYYEGDPIMIAKGSMPAVFLTRDKSTVQQVTNMEDEHILSVVINVVTDVTRDWGQAFNKISSMSDVWDFIEGRNSDGTLKITSLAYILRRYQTLAPKTWINLKRAIELDYGVGIEKRGPSIYSVEGIMKIEIRQHQPVPAMTDQRPLLTP